MVSQRSARSSKQTTSHPSSRSDPRGFSRFALLALFLVPFGPGHVFHHSLNSTSQLTVGRLGRCSKTSSSSPISALLRPLHTTHLCCFIRTSCTVQCLQLRFLFVFLFGPTSYNKPITLHTHSPTVQRTRTVLTVLQSAIIKTASLPRDGVVFIGPVVAVGRLCWSRMFSAASLSIDREPTAWNVAHGK
ncbi:hypothetical protein B0J18DRAFT_224377 [Chaetomium sp. MPI-SDFR-AT-0129]|nr:hypothetical protein B0J18DRAFT_224377 [Chaetomium sp. MPI-SDFR-AT-0129]